HTHPYPIISPTHSLHHAHPISRCGEEGSEAEPLNEPGHDPPSCGTPNHSARLIRWSVNDPRGKRRHQQAAERVGRILLELEREEDRKSTRLNSSHVSISYAVFC